MSEGKEFSPIFICTAQDGVCPYRNGKGVCIELVDASQEPWICDYLIVKRKEKPKDDGAW